MHGVSAGLIFVRLWNYFSKRLPTQGPWVTGVRATQENDLFTNGFPIFFTGISENAPCIV